MRKDGVNGPGWGTWKRHTFTNVVGIEGADDGEIFHALLLLQMSDDGCVQTSMLDHNLWLLRVC